MRDYTSLFIAMLIIAAIGFVNLITDMFSWYSSK